MPIYEYRCDPCQHRFEAFLIASSEQAICPKCQGTRLHKLMSTFAASVPGGYKSTQMGSAPSTNPAPGAETLPTTESSTPPKTGGCGGGCACH